MKDQLAAIVQQMHSKGILYSEAVYEFRKRFVLNVLMEEAGNQNRTAKALNMHRNTLRRTIEQFGLARDLRAIRGLVAKRRPRPAYLEREERDTA